MPRAQAGQNGRATESRPLFIHSLFRSGSTWYWDKFRRLDPWTAYYEPFHEALAQIGAHPGPAHGALHRQAEALRHPPQEAPYFAEYPLSASGRGAEGYRSEFAFESYCIGEAARDRPEEQYLRGLLRHAEGRRPVLGGCRSSLRSRWLRRCFGGDHVYLLRDPRSQWRSYCSYMPRSYFVASVLTIPALNPGVCWFRGLDDHLKLPPRAMLDAGFSPQDRIEFFLQAQSVYSDVERYLLFYWLWLVSLIENAAVCDYLLDVDALSCDPAAVEQAHRFHAGAGVDVDLSDCRAPRAGGIPAWTEGVERFVEALVCAVHGELAGAAIERIRSGGWRLGPTSAAALARVERQFRPPAGWAEGVQGMASPEFQQERLLVLQDMAGQWRARILYPKLEALTHSALGGRFLDLLNRARERRLRAR